MEWEYKILEFETWFQIMPRQRLLDIKEGITLSEFREIEKEGIFGKKTKNKRVPLNAKEVEERLSELGKEGWEMCGVSSLILASSIGPGSQTDKVHFIFKRRKIS